MKILIVVSSLMTILESFRVSIYFLRKDVSIIKKVSEIIILIIMIILCNNNLQYQGGKINIYLSIFLSLYVLMSFIYEIIARKEHISVLSVKNGIDASDTGIMFLNNNGEIILINNIMTDILTDLNIKGNYINNLTNRTIRRTEDSYVIKSLNKIWNLKISNEKEIILIDITNIYRLQEEQELQNKEIEENNKKILETIQNIEKIEKTKNLLKIKNNYHDKLGHKLALFTKYLEQKEKNTKDIEFLLDSIYEDTITNVSSSQKLDNLIKMYHIIGVNINLKGELPKKEKESNIFFEIIREAVTNAIRHANSTEVYIKIKGDTEHTKMTIRNNGKKPKAEIIENEGIKGMRRKIAQIGGKIEIITKPEFLINIEI